MFGKITEDHKIMKRVLALIGASFIVLYITHIEEIIETITTSTPTLTFRPSTSPTYVDWAVVVYYSERVVRGDFATKWTPEAVCEEGAYLRYGCREISVLVSTRTRPTRRRVRGMKGHLVSFGPHVAAPDVSEMWRMSLNLKEIVWTGCTDEGGTDVENCSDWTRIDGYGVTGHDRLHDSSASCGEEHRLLCVCKTKL